jgi:maltose alpha-D-glucosyltransferase / alpha-amylase
LSGIEDGGEAFCSPAEPITAYHSTMRGDGKRCVLLDPYGYRWFRVGGIDYLLNRTRL